MSTRRSIPEATHGRHSLLTSTLRPTTVEDAPTIQDAIASLRPGGSTNAAAGLQLGYDMARFAFRKEGINRVVLASDGVANVA